MDGNYSLSDIAAVNDKDNGFGGGSAWVLIILFALIFGWGNGGFGGGNAAANAVSQADLQRAIDLNSIQEGQRALGADIQRTAYEGIAITKDAQYNNLANIKDLQGAVNLGFANQQNCCCETNRNIDSVKFDMANYTASVNSNIDAKFAALEKSQIQAQLDAANQRINDLQLQNAMCGIPRITNTAYGVAPLNWCGTSYNGCGC